MHMQQTGQESAPWQTLESASFQIAQSIINAGTFSKGNGRGKRVIARLKNQTLEPKAKPKRERKKKDVQMTI